MNVPQWLLVVIWILEFGILVAQLCKGAWIEALYWLGVMLINIALFKRM